jgi:ribulose-5-phosphate 4-epimerase/fuculose-1-phosphate aldolase
MRRGEVTIPGSAPGRYAAGEQQTLYVSLSPQAELSLLARMLYHDGYNDHNWGHITYAQEDGTLLLTPWEVPWDEVRASDILRIDTDGRLLAGKWSVTPAIHLHLEIHRTRRDVRVVIHHHAEWGTVWAALGEIPAIYSQQGAQVGGELVLYKDYDGNVSSAEIAARNAAAIGANDAALLANHGVLILGDSIARAHQRAVALETRCRMAWRVKCLGVEKGQPMSGQAVDGLVELTLSGGSLSRAYHAMVRREILRDPTVIM